MRKTVHIPLNKQDSGAIGGIDIHYFPGVPQHYDHLAYTHRDDYYIFIILTSGDVKLFCDMQEINARSTGLLMVKPLQVHSPPKKVVKASGWFLSVAPFLIPAHCRSVFHNLSVSQQYTELSKVEKKKITDILDVLRSTFSENSSHKPYIIKGLFDAFINRVAAQYMLSANKVVEPQSQAQSLSVKFSELLSANSCANTPAFFAAQLNVTTSHLNDCVKSVTGMSLTQSIQNTMLLEAKRNLYYTNNTIKEVAYELGFEDHAYFSRLFKKLTGTTPLAFRRQFRE